MTTYNLDETAKRGFAMRPGSGADWYLIASYAYYELDTPILTDAYYDQLCRELLVVLENGELAKDEDVNLMYILADNLKAGTYLGVGYPQRTKRSAPAWVAIVQSGRHYGRELESA